jgi:hypothetical protein
MHQYAWLCQQPAHQIEASTAKQTPSHPYKCQSISYGVMIQITPEIDTYEILDAPCKLQVQEIIGSLL